MTNIEVLKRLKSLMINASSEEDIKVLQHAIHAVYEEGFAYEKPKYSPEFQKVYRLGYRAGYQAGRYKARQLDDMCSSNSPQP